MMMMKFLSAFLLLLAFASSVDANPPLPSSDVCLDRTYQLKAPDGSVVGVITIEDDLDPTLTIKLVMSDLTPDSQDDIVPTLIQSITATASCSVTDTVTPQTVTVNLATPVPTHEFELTEPLCPSGEELVVAVDAEVYKPSGLDALNYLFPHAVQFHVELDPWGAGDIPSYYDTIFSDDVTLADGTPSPLAGKRIDGFCVDVSTVMYASNGGTIYSYEGTALPYTADDLYDYTDVDVALLPCVAWLINNYVPLESYSTPFGEYKMTSSTIQRAIWWIMGAGQSSSGLYGMYNDDVAKWLKDLALPHTDYVPGCDDLIPIVLVPKRESGDDYQHTIVTTTFAALGFPCGDPVVATGSGRTLCEPTGRQGTTTVVLPPPTTDDPGTPPPPPPLTTVVPPPGPGDGTTTTGIPPPLTTTEIPSTPSAWGDPHFKTWLGEDFDYHGACDLVFLEDPSLDVVMHIRTAIRFDWSYISSVALYIKGDLLEVAAWGNYFVNGVNTPEMNATFGGYPITMDQKYKKRHTFQIRLSENEYIEFKTFKELVAVKVHASSSRFANSRGILGHPSTGTMLGRDGVTQYSSQDQDVVNAYGQEWQVRHTEPKLFHINRAPQYPAQCELPSPEDLEAGSNLRANAARERRGRRLQEKIVVSRADAAEACSHWSANHESCVQDVIRSGDLELAKADFF